MDRRIALVCVLTLFVPGCQGQRSTYDPIFGQTQIPPAASGTIGAAGSADPYYNGSRLTSPPLVTPGTQSPPATTGASPSTDTWHRGGSSGWSFSR